MLAKSWKKIGLFILIIACLWNVTSKLVKRMSFSDSLKSTLKIEKKVDDEEETTDEEQEDNRQIKNVKINQENQ